MGLILIEQIFDALWCYKKLNLKNSQLSIHLVIGKSRVWLEKLQEFYF